MYFVISDLAKINNMYRFSLAAFLRIFQKALKTKQVQRHHNAATQSSSFELLTGTIQCHITWSILIHINLYDMNNMNQIVMHFVSKSLYRKFKISLND